MKNIKRHIKGVEAMLATAEGEKQAFARSRFAASEIESIRAIVDVARALDTLLDSMDRLIPTEEED